MLSRLAGNTYWLARYLERGENTARLCAAAQRAELTGDGDPAAPWSAALRIAADVDAYASRFGSVAPRAATAFLLLDGENPSSVRMCWRAVRENARSARHLYTDAFFEAANATWMMAQRMDEGELDAPETLCDWFADRSRLVRGAGTDLARDEVWQVLAIGQALERIDSTIRTLLELLPPLLAEPDAVARPGTPAARRWEVLMQAVGAHELYRRRHHQPGDLRATWTLLVDRADHPRSLTGALGGLLPALAGATGDHGAATIACAASASARLPGEGLDGDWQASLGGLLANTVEIGERFLTEHGT